MRPLTPAQRRYAVYLQSDGWRARRARILARADAHCERCGRFAGLNPHGPHLETELAYCGEPACDFCRCYFEGDGTRNDAELQTLEVHHVTYVRCGHERDTDLLALCWGCHEETWDTDRQPAQTEA